MARWSLLALAAEEKAASLLRQVPEGEAVARPAMASPDQLALASEAAILAMRVLPLARASRSADKAQAVAPEPIRLAAALNTVAREAAGSRLVRLQSQAEARCTALALALVVEASPLAIIPSPDRPVA